MAIEKQIKIEVTSSGFDQATTSAKELEKSLVDVEEQSDSLASSMQGSSNAVLANGGAMGLLNDLTGGLAMTVKDAVEATDLFTKSSKASTVAQTASNFVIGTSTGLLKAFRIALAATGVGLLVLALVALIVNFEKVQEWLTNLIPGFGMVADAIGSLINMVTDFIGITSDATRELDRLNAEAEKTAKKNQEFLDLYGDKYDQYTKRKIQANIDYADNVKKVNADETKSEAEKLATIKAYREKADREIIAADKDRNEKLQKNREDAAKKAMDDAKKAADDAKKAIENRFKTEESALNELYKKQTAKNIEVNNSNLLNEERYLESRLALYKKYGKDVGDIEIAIAENKKKKDKELNDFLDAIAKAKAESDKQAAIEQDATLQSIADEGNAIYNQKQEEKLAADLKRKEAYQMLYSDLTNAFQNAASSYREGSNEQMALDEAGLQLAKVTADGKIEIMESVSAASKVASKIAGESTAAGKTLAIAGTTIDTFQSSIAAYKGMVQAIPGPVGIAAGVVAVAASVATGLATVKKILSVKVPGASSAGAPSTGGGPAVQIPQFNIVGQSSENQLASTIAERQNQPQKAYVVGSDVTTQQSLDRQIVNNATFI